VPDWPRTIHGVGDLHAGGIRRARVQTMLDDVNALPEPALHLQIGDATEHGREAEDVMARRWMKRLPGRHATILGNHDIMGNKRRTTQWAKAYGYRSKNFVIHLPFRLRIIVVGPDRDYEPEKAGYLSPATLAFLERELKAHHAFDCWVACHWPLRRTVMGNSNKFYTSEMTKFYAKPDARIRAVLARNRNAKAWLSGHTHSPLRAPGLVTRAKLPGGRSIVAANLSALVYIGKEREPSDPICSVYLTHLPGKIEFRFRDHRRGAWIAPHKRKVVPVRV
jgi:3',5'-cyclic AMP phosphodiesterase CpdA